LAAALFPVEKYNFIVREVMVIMVNNACLMIIRPLFGKRHQWCLPEIIPCLCLALAALTVMTCSGCTEEKNPPPQPPRAELKQMVDMLNRHFQTFPPGKEWKISSIIAQGKQVLITVAIPPDQASLIRRQPADNQFRLVAEQICPGKSEEVWQHLPSDSNVKVLPSVSGQVFIEADCGH
jgi:hypothetical protein